MAGILPGVEAARRRRFHQSSNNNYCSESSSSSSSSCITRRSSFCLYASGHDYHLSSTTSYMRNPISQQAIYDHETRLGTAAREAKRRLDQRLWRSETKTTTRSTNIEPRSRISDINHQLSERGDQLKRSGSQRVNWLKLKWKSSEQEECAVCLELFKAEEELGKRIMQLACAHKFHTNCLVPWLEGNAHCPCCRMKIPPS